MSNSTKPWRDALPQLHNFNALTHKAFADEPIRQKFLDQVAACIQLGAGSGNHAIEREWEAERREYFESTVFKPGNARFRRQSEDIAGLEWHVYDRWLRHETELSEVPKHIRVGHYYKLVSGKAEKRPCFNDDRSVDSNGARRFNPSAGAGHIYVGAWTPPLLASLDQAQLCHIPLPPEPLSMGRDYSLPEVAFALCVLHDADHGFEPFLPADHHLRSDGRDVYADWLAFVRVPELRTSARDAWVTTLEPLLLRADQAMLGPTGIYTYIRPDRKTKPLTKRRAYHLLTGTRGHSNPSQAIDRLAKDGSLRVMKSGGLFLFDYMDFPQASWSSLVTPEVWRELRATNPELP